MERSSKKKTKKTSGNKKNKTKLKQFMKKALIVLVLIILICIGIGFAILAGLAKDAKEVVKNLYIENENSVVLDKDGEVIAQLSGDENRETIKLSEMPSYLPEAFIAIEDERFREHSGVDVKRTTAAVANYILHAGRSSFGGSTITQQVIKNYTKEDERTWKRKANEMVRAYYLEKELSKDQILELYLNLIFLGGNTYGVEIASTYYFNKSASELSIAESAFLAGINNSPNSYNPFEEDNEKTLERIKTRTTTVLSKMKELKKITDEEYDNAIKEVEEGLKFNQGTIRQTVYSYHTDAAVEQVIKELMEKNPEWNRKYTEQYVKSSGLTIYSTQDSKIQETMENEAKDSKYIIHSRKTKDKDGNAVTAQLAMVLIDHKTGYVLGTVGGIGEKTDAFGQNRATQSERQTGSSMKTLAVLAPGINKGIITGATVFDDVPTSFGDYKPKNYGNYRGLITVRQAISSSQNIPMVKGMQVLGTKNSIEFLKSAGITSIDDEKDNYLGLALGGLTWGISPLEMAGAYAAIANDGVYIEPTFYTKVVDKNGNTILEADQETRTIMSKAAAYVVKEILTEPVKNGTSTYMTISGMSVAAKTGTTNSDKDRWFCGFTPYYTGATWYGYDDPEEVRYSGYNPASLYWRGVMRPTHENLKSATFAQTKPDGVVTATVCKSSGLLVTDACKEDPRGDQSYTEFFVKGTVPTKTCTCHVTVDICDDTGLLANEFCPNKTKKTFITRPNSDTDTAWKSAADAQYMLTITDTCAKHTKTPDQEKPVITLRGDNPVNLKLNAKYHEAGATATDNEDGSLTDKIEISGTVDTSKAGTYIITYKVKDSSGNEATVTRKVIVSGNKPTITLNGSSSITLEYGEEFNDPKAKATDSIDGDLTDKIKVSGEIDTTKPGSYTIKYSVTNSSGETASVERKVVVKEKANEDTDA